MVGVDLSYALVSPQILCVLYILLLSNLTLQIYSCNCLVSTKQDLFKIKEQDS